MLHHLLFPLLALAFHVPDHVQITARAVNELSACGLLPAQWTGDVTTAVEKADENEDYNLFRKWTHYSHYYNPYHPLDQYRADSSASVTEAAATLVASPSDPVATNEAIGRMIHHIQDASTPAHAVPVAHSFRDGFELFDISAYYSEPLSPTACTQIAAVEPMEMLHSNAIATLNSLEEPLSLRAGEAEVQDTWSGTYWTAGEGNSFGQYGIVGDNFGATSLSFPDGTLVTVDPQTYFHFKRARAEAAVRATEAVILWATRLRGY